MKTKYYCQLLENTKAEFDDRVVVFLEHMNNFVQPTFLSLWECTDVRDKFDFGEVGELVQQIKANFNEYGEGFKTLAGILKGKRQVTVA